MVKFNINSQGESVPQQTSKISSAKVSKPTKQVVSKPVQKTAQSSQLVKPVKPVDQPQTVQGVTIPKKKSWAWLWFLLVFLLVGAGLVVYFFLF